MALIISRKNGQSVMVDGCATITVYCTSNVSLHIEAPRDVHILRGELKAKEENDGCRLGQASAGASIQLKGQC
jgi:sRNA-binding carbon storage regulator CsrA